MHGAVLKNGWAWIFAASGNDRRTKIIFSNATYEFNIPFEYCSKMVCFCNRLNLEHLFLTSSGGIAYGISM